MYVGWALPSMSRYSPANPVDGEFQTARVARRVRLGDAQGLVFAPDANAFTFWSR